MSLVTRNGADVGVGVGDGDGVCASAEVKVNWGAAIAAVASAGTSFTKLRRFRLPLFGSIVDLSVRFFFDSRFFIVVSYRKTPTATEAL
jgi:hypothetical protein